MSLLDNIKTDNTVVQEEEKDNLGGFQPIPSGIYLSVVTMAYLNQAASGAVGVVVLFKDKATGKEFKSDGMWIASGDAKGNKNYYVSKKDQSHHFLPGYLQAQAFCKLLTGEELNKQDRGTKVIKKYNAEAKGEVPTEVEALLDLIGKEVYVGVIDVIEDKRTKSASGAYLPSGETRRKSEVDKFFSATDKRTQSEISSGTEKAEFYDDWLKKYEGQTIDKTAAKKGEVSKVAEGEPTTTASPTAEAPVSLFGTE